MGLEAPELTNKPSRYQQTPLKLTSHNICNAELTLGLMWRGLAPHDHGIRSGVVLGMRQTHHDLLHSSGGRVFRRRSGEFHSGLTRGLSNDFHIEPADFFSDAGAEGFRDRFLRRESSREVELRSLLFLAILALGLCEDSRLESLPEFIER